MWLPIVSGQPSSASAVVAAAARLPSASVSKHLWQEILFRGIELAAAHQLFAEPIHMPQIVLR